MRLAEMREAAGLTVHEVAWLTGMQPTNLLLIESGRLEFTHTYQQRILPALTVSSDSEIFTNGWVTYPQLAHTLKSELSDPNFALRLARQSYVWATQVKGAEREAFHAPVPTLKHRGWNALIAGLAERSYGGALEWARSPSFYSPEMFSPMPLRRTLGIALRDTPMELKGRGVILAAGELVTA